METAPSGNGSRSDLPSELGFAIAPRETDPTPEVTRSSDVSRVHRPLPWLLGHAHGPEIEFRPETETQPEVQVSMSTTCEGVLGAARPPISDTASQYVTADRPKQPLHSQLVRK